MPLFYQGLYSMIEFQSNMTTSFRFSFPETYFLDKSMIIMNFLNPLMLLMNRLVLHKV